MDRQQALDAVKAGVKNENLVKHMLATEAIMKTLARRLGEDEQEWGVTGLLHDIDVETTEMDRHGKLGAEMAKSLGASDATAHAILSHNETHGIPRESGMDKALYCADPLTGLITAAVLVRPDRKISTLEAKSVLKRFKEKSFAAGASREQIGLCSDIGLSLDEFVQVGLEAMKGIAPELGL